MESRRMALLLGLLVASAVCAAAGDDVELRLFNGAQKGSAVPGVGADACGPQVDIETPACSVVEQRSKFELRLYPAGEIWVESVVANSSFEAATLTGFYRCFNFISGKNSEDLKIEMTAPVHIKPVPQESGYSVSFFVPSRFKSVNDLPKPTDPNVYFYQPEAALKAVIGPFGGFPTDKDYEAKFAKLKKALQKDGLKFDEASVVYAGYSSPFQFRGRKQEVHVNVVPL